MCLYIFTAFTLIYYVNNVNYINIYDYIFMYFYTKYMYKYSKIGCTVLHNSLLILNKYCKYVVLWFAYCMYIKLSNIFY